MSSGHDPRQRTAALAALVAACGSPGKPPPATDDALAAVRVAPPITLSSPVTRTLPSSSRGDPGAALPDGLAEPPIELPKQESFQLLDPGQGARSKLRYTLAAGTTEYAAETRLSSRHITGATFTPPVALPAIRDGFAITVAPDRPGTLAVRALTGEAATPSADADAYLAPWRTLLQNRRITVAFDARGAFRAPRFNDDPTGARSARAIDELVQRLLTILVPVPAEPVALGARWQVVTILRQGPAYAKQTATYTLTSRGPAGWKLHLRLQRVGEDQRIADPSLPSGTAAELLALFRVLEGDVEVDPRHPVITHGALAIESRMHVRLQEAAQPASEQVFEDTGSVTFSYRQ